MKTITLYLLTGLSSLSLLFSIFYSSSNKASTAEAVQSVGASFSISSVGAANWSLPIHVPPGTNGVEPKLSLDYTSGTLNGLLGIGFQLSGISSISRVGATIAQDGFSDAVAYGANDRYSLNGNRLMVMNGGTNGEAGSIYHTQKESWTKVEAVGQQGSGPQYFKVWLKKGSYLEYGNTADSKVLAVGLSGSKAGSVREWQLNKFTDLNGNSIEVTYTQTPPDVNQQAITACAGQGQSYPLRIDYTINAGMAPMRSVQFVYEVRPDSIPTFVGGGRFSTRARISQIQTWVKSTATDSSLIRTVTLDYEASTPLNSSRLQSVTVCGNGDCYETTSFDWTDGANTMVAAYVPSGPPSSAGFLGDYNGDGRSDFLSTDNGMIYLGTQSGFAAAVRSNVPINSNQMILIDDYDGDGLSDLYIQEGSEGKLYYGENGNFLTTPVTIERVNMSSSCYPDQCLWQGDFNGDGLDDFAYLQGSDCTINFGSPDRSVGLTAASPQEGLELSEGGNFAADFNGDGLTDLLNCSSNTTRLYLSDFSKSDGFKEVIEQDEGMSFDISSNTGFAWIGDYNGDGSSDIFAKGTDGLYRLYRANGLGFEDGVHINNLNFLMDEVWPSDYNNDGLMDFYATSNTKQGNIVLSNGIGFEGAVQIPSTFTEGKTTMGDFNGDGLADMYNAYKDTIAYGGNSATPGIQYNQRGNYIRQISNGMGSNIQIQYKPITDPDVYTTGSSAAINGVEGIRLFHQFNPVPLAAVQNSHIAVEALQDRQFVVGQWSENDGRGNEYDLYYQYGGAKFDYSGYGFLGFESMTSIDSQMNSVSEDFYLQDFPLSGYKDSTNVKSLTGELMKASAYTWSANEDQNDLWQVTRTRWNQYDYANGQMTNQQKLQYWYDDYCNNILFASIGDTDRPDTLWAMHTYVNNTDAWQLGYLISTIQSADSSGNNPITSRKYNYLADRMLVDSVQTWLSDDDSWLYKSFGYDQYGNMTFRASCMGDTSFTIYDDVYHTFPVQGIAPKNAQGEKLSTYTLYDPAYGHQSQVTDPNGNVFYKHIDGLGRFNYIEIPYSQGPALTAIRKNYLNEATGYSTQTIMTRDWAGQVTDTLQTYYDALNRNYKTKYRGWNDQWVYNDKEYNAVNQVETYTFPYFEDQPVNWSKREFDPLHRVTKHVVPYGPQDMNDSLVTEYEYLDMSMQINEAVNTPDAKTSTVTYNYFNSEMKVTDYVNADGQSTSFNWDLLARLYKVTDPTGVETKASWNSISRNEWYYSPSFDTIFYNYAPCEGQMQSTNALQQTLTYSYDNLGRLIDLSDDSGTLHAYTYDLTTSANGLGRLCQVSQDNGATVYSFGFDPFGNVTQTDITMDGKSWQEVASYNPDMSLDQLTYPDGSRANRTYANNGHLVSIDFMDPTQQSVEAFRVNERNEMKQLENFTYGNGVTTEKGYDVSSYLNTQKVYSSGNDLLISKGYSWGKNLRINSISDSLNSLLTQQYDYDPTGRLTKLYFSDTYDSLAYDHSGNMIWNDSTQFQYGNYQVKSATREGDTLYIAQYDACGNLTDRVLINDGDTTAYRYSFNTLLQMDSVFRNDTLTYTYFYDVQGDRNRKYNHLTLVTTYYVTNNLTETSSSTNGVSQTVNLSLGHQIIAAFTGSINSVDYYHWDQNGSTLMTTNQDGLSNNSLSYSPYGQTDSDNQANLPYQFNGKEYDPYSGLYYFSFRYYDPFTGRFTSSDDQLGAGFTTADAFNNYAFCLNNPISFFDPTGHNEEGSATSRMIIEDVGVGATEAVLSVAAPEALPEEAEVDEDLASKQLEGQVKEEEKVEAPKNPKKRASREEVEGGPQRKSQRISKPVKSEYNAYHDHRRNVAKELDEYFGKYLDNSHNYDDVTDADWNPKTTAKRPGLRKWVVEMVWNTDSKLVDGERVAVCPNLKYDLSWDRTEHRTEQWHMGHKPGYEFKYLWEAYENNIITRQQMIEEYNDPEHYQVESPESNRSHNFEHKGGSKYDFSKYKKINKGLDLKSLKSGYIDDFRPWPEGPKQPDRAPHLDEEGNSMHVRMRHLDLQHLRYAA